MQAHRHPEEYRPPLAAFGSRGAAAVFQGLGRNPVITS